MYSVSFIPHMATRKVGITRSIFVDRKTQAQRGYMPCSQARRE